MFACWPLRERLTWAYFNVFSNNVNKKMTKNALFLPTFFPIEIGTLSFIISLKCAEFLALTGNAVLG